MITIGSARPDSHGLTESVGMSNGEDDVRAVALESDEEDEDFMLGRGTRRLLLGTTMSHTLISTTSSYWIRWTSCSDGP